MATEESISASCPRELVVEAARSASEVRMQVTAGRLVSLAVAVAYVIAAFAWEKSWTFALTVAAATLLPLALIWFPDFLGGLTGWGTRASIDRPSPPPFVAAAGWLLLLGLPVLLLAVNHW
jgi:hypothetical protein